MIRIVLDTNVLMSGIFWAGYPGQILDAWHNRRVKLIVSPDIISEYFRIGDSLSKKYLGADVSRLLELVTINGELVIPKPSNIPISRDIDDDKFITTAIAAKCKFIVSGDKDLLDVNGHLGIQILKPSDFVKNHLTSGIK